MGVKPVDFGDGRGPVPIDSSNAKQALQRRSELNLDTAQIKWAEKFLSQDEKDQIFYSEDESKTRGQDAINTDADGDGEKDTDKDAGAGAGVALGASIGAVAGAATCAVGMASAGGICALIGAGIGVAAGVVAMIFSFPNNFDSGYSARETFSGEAQGNIETLNTANDDLVDSMDSMTEDSETYAEQTNLYTLAVNDNTNEKADIQARLMKIDPNDTERKAELEDQMKELEEEDNSEMIAGMDETKARMDEYSSKNNEALGMVESGTEVADFLKEGNHLSKMAMASAIMLTVAGATFGICMTISHPNGPWDAWASIAAKILFAVAVGTVGFAATKMFSNSSKEGEFGDNGDAMGAAVGDLNSMAEQQQEFYDATEEGYAATDEKAAEDMAKATEAANKAMQQMGGSNGPITPDADGGIYKEGKEGEEGAKTA